MKTTVIKIDPNIPIVQIEPELAVAATALKNGELVAFPTETVYGLGAIYSNDTALTNIFKVKGRPSDNPLIVHIWQLPQLDELVKEISPRAKRLIQHFWPGPLTIIFPKKPGVSTIVSAGLDTIAVRMPIHPIAQELLRLTNIPVAAPSANLSGKPSPTRGIHVVTDLDGRIPFIIEAGPCQAGIESTVISLTGDIPIILRPGSITREMLEESLQEVVEISGLDEVNRPQAPGMKYRHYAPQAPVTLVEGDNEKVVAKITELLSQLPENSKTIILSSTENKGRYQHLPVFDLGPQSDPVIAATRLYDLLRLCDQSNADHIFIEGTTAKGVGMAITNRLYKAAGGNIIHVS